jgi:iron complex transport system substrate-binding protein
VKRERLALLLALVALVALLGCRRPRNLGAVGDDAPPGSQPAQRVVSISASTTETLFAIGAGRQVVGRSRYCDYPPEALALPVVGGFTDPNLEAILGLAPNLVVGARGPIGPGIARTLEERGIATYFPETERLDAILVMIEGLGARTGHGTEALRLVESMRARRQAIEAAVASLPKPRVLLLFAKKPISVAGKGSFPDEMLTLAGGTNAITEGAAYPTLSLEKVLALDPDLLLDAEMGGGVTAFDSTWSSVRAVREGKVVHIDDETVLRPGPRVMEGVATLARAMHPGLNL